MLGGIGFLHRNQINLAKVIAVFLIPFGQANAGGLLSDIFQQQRFQLDKIEKQLDLQEKAIEKSLRDTSKAMRDAGRDAELITRGAKAPIFFAPWAAGVALKHSSDFAPLGDYFCGATIIHPQWLITEANCLRSLEAAEIDVLYGASSILDSRRMSVREIHYHPDYRRDRGYQRGSAALLHVESPLEVPREALPRIPTADGIQLAALEARVFGWGSVTEYSRQSESLVQIDVSLLSWDLCNNPYYYAGQVGSDELCATPKTQGIDACQGFSGSGLVANDIASREVTLVGVVSWGHGCGRENKPTVYKDVRRYATWIAGTIEERKD